MRMSHHLPTAAFAVSLQILRLTEPELVPAARARSPFTTLPDTRNFAGTFCVKVPCDRKNQRKSNPKRAACTLPFTDVGPRLTVIVRAPAR
jgi:hypothetical protein